MRAGCRPRSLAGWRQNRVWEPSTPSASAAAAAQTTAELSKLKKKLNFFFLDASFEVCLVYARVWLQDTATCAPKLPRTELHRGYLWTQTGLWEQPTHRLPLLQPWAQCRAAQALVSHAWPVPIYCFLGSVVGRDTGLQKNIQMLEHIIFLRKFSMFSNQNGF